MESPSRINEELITLEDTSVFVRSCGQGPAVLLLHAGIADSRMWLPQLQELGNTFRLIAPDLRGYGRSPIPNRPFAYHQDVALLMDHFGIDRAWLVAASYGSMVAVDFSLVYPQRVTGLVLAPPTIAGFQKDAGIEAFNDEEDRLLEEGKLAEAVELNMRFWVDGPQRQAGLVDPVFRAEAAQMQLDAFKVPVPEGAELLGVDFVAMDRLGEIDFPVMVIVGDQDEAAVRDHAALVAQKIPDARFQHFPDAGHLLSLENASEFNEIVRVFIANSPADHL